MRTQAAIAVGITALAASACGCTSGRTTQQLDKLHEVCDIVEAEFYDAGALDHRWSGATAKAEQSIREMVGTNYRTAEVGAIKNLLNSSGASHTAYYVRVDREWFDLLDLFRESTDPAIQNAIESEFPGTIGGRVLVPSIGAVMTRDSNWRPVVSEVMPGSVAEETGIVPGDALTSTIRHVYWTYQSFLHEGFAAFLTFQRSDDPNSRYQSQITPALVNPTEEYLEYMTNSASVIERDGKRLGYVRIYSWAGQRYQDRLEELLAAEPLASADGVILDIRGGWGGASPEYLDLFDAPMPVLTMIGRDGVANVWDPSEDLPERTFYWRKPVVLLVDGGSRSGKEIIAYAFKKHGVGPVVGVRTAGAVLAGRPFILSDGSLLYLAVADVLVDGERLEGVGVEPDIVVERDLPFSNGADPQLEAAYEALVGEIVSKQSVAP